METATATRCDDSDASATAIQDVAIVSALGLWLLAAVLLRQDSVLVVPALLVLVPGRAGWLATAWLPMRRVRLVI